jgi:pimeloyl-ACP methyl ester carboxylesterase
MELPQLPPYVASRPSRSLFIALRGLEYHVRSWGDAALATPDRPPLLLLHGWMDVGASFQFVVDALAAAESAPRWVLAPDWRGFGLTSGPATDSYFHPDYLGDLDALLRAAGIEGAVDLVGHSMGGNVAMSYAGVRPRRVRRLVNLEGFGLPATRPQMAPERLAKWLDQLAEPQTLRSYGSLDAVAARLRANNPLLGADKAAWLAPHWSHQGQDGRWHIRGDPAHKRISPVLYRADEVVETWSRIEAPVLWAEGDRTEIPRLWGDSYPRTEFETRLARVGRLERVLLAPCGHMLHHDQPEALAAHLARFLG